MSVLASYFRGGAGAGEDTAASRGARGGTWSFWGGGEEGARDWPRRARAYVREVHSELENKCQETTSNKCQYWPIIGVRCIGLG